MSNRYSRSIQGQSPLRTEDEIRNINDIIHEDLFSKVNNVFSYFDNYVRVMCNFDTLLDYYNKQESLKAKDEGRKNQSAFSDSRPGEAQVVKSADFQIRVFNS